MSTLKLRIRKFFDLSLMEISPEREEEIIKKIATTVVKWGMDFPAELLFTGLMPVSTIFSQIFILPASPFLEFIGLNAYDYVSFFNNKNNLQRLLNRIEELKSTEEHP